MPTATASSTTPARPRRGLANQGWKDSEDSVFHADGTRRRGPDRAGRGAGLRLRRVPRPWPSSPRRRGEPEAGDALGGARRSNCGRRSSAGSGSRSWAPTRSPSTATASPAGCAPPTRATCCSPGCRRRSGPSGSRPSCWAPASTPAGASARSPRARPRYNPMSYHNGSVWPHDTALCAAGMARYGARDGVARLAERACSRPRSSSTCGCPSCSAASRARAGEPPIAYPVACLPQAWAAGVGLHAAAGLPGPAHRRLARRDPRRPATAAGRHRPAHGPAPGGGRAPRSTSPSSASATGWRSIRKAATRARSPCSRAPETDGRQWSCT